MITRLSALIMVLLALPALAETVDVVDQPREYEIFVPRGNGPWPLIVVLHGGNDWAGRIRRRMGWDDLADREGFAVAYPIGINRGWNDGRPNTARYGRGEAPDDVAFFDTLLDRLIAEEIADPDRVYVTGPSNGGMMAMRLMCDRAERIAGAAPVIANMPVTLEPLCTPARPVPVLVINGTADTLVPWNGGVVSDNEERGRVLSTDATMAFWQAANGCSGTNGSEALPDLDSDDGGTITRIIWQDCEADTVLLQVNGGGHRVPGDNIRFGEGLVDALLGPQNNDIRAAEEIWSFFDD